MARSSVRFEVSKDQLDKALAQVIGNTLTRIGTTAKARAQQIITEETAQGGRYVRDGRTVKQVSGGALAASITFQIKREGDAILLFLESNAGEYALYQHEGTGIYGKRGTPIKPKRSPFLVFADPKTGNLIFAKEVRGTPAKKFLTRGARFAIDRILRSG